MTNTPTPPGWYPDPSAPGGVRWWDGQAWTTHAARPWGQPAWGAPAWGTDLPRLIAAEADAARWARWGAYGQALWIVLGGVVFAAVFRELWDFIQEVADTPEGEPVDVPLPNLPPAFFLFQILGLVQWGAIIAWLVWQHRANTAAQALGIRLSRSPGWGIAGWFIPVVSFWFPYEAARDNLPVDDPNRPLVLRWWLGWFGLSAVLWILALGWFAGGAVVGVPLAIGAAAYGWWWATTAGRVVASVEAAHRRLAERADAIR